MPYIRPILLALVLLLPLGAVDATQAVKNPGAAGSASAAPLALPAAGAPSAPAAPASATVPVAETHWLILKYRQGGAVMHIFLLVSIWMVATLIERLVRLRRSSIVPDGLAKAAEAAWSRGDDAGVVAACAAQPSVLADMIAYAWGLRGASGADILAGSAEISSRGIRRHLQKLTPLAIITTLGPILGLFGAVIGLIECFEAMKTAGSMGDVKQIAGGIAIAFIATATGMAVAMPALVAYHMLKMRTNQFLIALEQDFSGLITRQVIHARPAPAPVAAPTAAAPAAGA